LFYDFNIPDIEWSNMEIKAGIRQRNTTCTNGPIYLTWSCPSSGQIKRVGNLAIIWFIYTNNPSY
jgi:hypothetical protein